MTTPTRRGHDGVRPGSVRAGRFDWWRGTGLVLAFMAGYMSLAQPGICPCWLLKDVRDIHPHPAGHPEIPHSHLYLFQMFDSAPAVAPRLPVVSPAVFLQHLSARGLWRGFIYAAPGEASDSPPPPTPPPEILLVASVFI